MNSTDAMEIINAICGKIGIVYDKALGLVPYIVRYNIACCLTSIFATAVVAVVSAFLIHMAKKNAAEYNEQHKNDVYPIIREWFEYVGGMIGSLGLFIAGVLLLVFGVLLIKWIVSPEISTLQWALRLIGG